MPAVMPPGYDPRSGAASVMAGIRAKLLSTLRPDVHEIAYVHHTAKRPRGAIAERERTRRAVYRQRHLLQSRCAIGHQRVLTTGRIGAGNAVEPRDETTDRRGVARARHALLEQVAAIAVSDRRDAGL